MSSTRPSNYSAHVHAPSECQHGSSNASAAVESAKPVPDSAHADDVAEPKAHIHSLDHDGSVAPSNVAQPDALAFVADSLDNGGAAAPGSGPKRNSSAWPRKRGNRGKGAALRRRERIKQYRREAKAAVRIAAIAAAAVAASRTARLRCQPEEAEEGDRSLKRKERELESASEVLAEHVDVKRSKTQD